jgi:hypothetical protein
VIAAVPFRAKAEAAARCGNAAGKRSPDERSDIRGPTSPI